MPVYSEKKKRGENFGGAGKENFGEQKNTKKP